MLTMPPQLPSPSGQVPPVDRWEEASGDKFLVRGADYLKTKKKVPSAATFYRRALPHKSSCIT